MNVKERFTKIDTHGNEWMQASQYKRAVEKDFDVILSVQVIYLAVRNNIIVKQHFKLTLGKKCYNYTQSVLNFLENSPKIAPSNFTQKKYSFISSQKSKAKKALVAKYGLTKPKVNTKSKKETKKSDDALLSIAEEKQKYEQIKREKAEFEFDIIKGNYIAVDDLTVLLADIAVSTRQAIKAIIPRLALLVAAETDVKIVKDLLERETDIGLNHTEKLETLIEDSFVKINE